MKDVIRDKGRLEHMLSAIDRVFEFTQGLSKESLSNDVLRLHATIYNVQIIGEAVYKLTDDFKISHPQTMWVQIEKMRHILVHDYYHINMDVLWIVVTEDLKPLQEQIKSYLAE